MRIVADNKEEYADLSLIQKQITQLFKAEKGSGSRLEGVYKKFINTSIEKTYEKPGDSTKIANTNSTMDTSDPNHFIAYLVHAAVNRKKIAMEYTDAKGKTSKRVIEPHSWRNDQVVGWCHERSAWRQFKPRQIARIAVTDQDFDRSEDVEIAISDAKDMAHLIL